MQVSGHDEGNADSLSVKLAVVSDAEHRVEAALAAALQVRLAPDGTSGVQPVVAAAPAVPTLPESRSLAAPVDDVVGGALDVSATRNKRGDDRDGSVSPVQRGLRAPMNTTHFSADFLKSLDAEDEEEERKGPAAAGTGTEAVSSMANADDLQRALAPLSAASISRVAGDGGGARASYPYSVCAERGDSELGDRDVGDFKGMGLDVDTAIEEEDLSGPPPLYAPPQTVAMDPVMNPLERLAALGLTPTEGRTTIAAGSGSVGGPPPAQVPTSAGAGTWAVAGGDAVGGPPPAFTPAQTVAMAPIANPLDSLAALGLVPTVGGTSAAADARAVGGPPPAYTPAQTVALAPIANPLDTLAVLGLGPGGISAAAADARAVGGPPPAYTPAQTVALAPIANPLDTLAVLGLGPGGISAAAADARAVGGPPPAYTPAQTVAMAPIANPLDNLAALGLAPTGTFTAAGVGAAGFDAGGRPTTIYSPRAPAARQPMVPSGPAPAPTSPTQPNAVAAALAQLPPELLAHLPPAAAALLQAPLPPPLPPAPVSCPTAAILAGVDVQDSARFLPVASAGAAQPPPSLPRPGLTTQSAAAAAAPAGADKAKFDASLAHLSNYELRKQNELLVSQVESLRAEVAYRRECRRVCPPGMHSAVPMPAHLPVTQSAAAMVASSAAAMPWSLASA
eukprot:TRINITY_DN10064_c0_g1_i1.p1 TRINITY_DN10064_c0_g1~~TRINITY_DN10064_c0_g1_i1.p1  ORF type:complete len:679 (-),score=128.89 TRINITY_DN10064_c0_g1_i1:189-2225(-)